MFRRLPWVAAPLLFASILSAQTPPAAPATSDSWVSTPAAASSSASRRGIALPAADPGGSHFKFKDSRADGPMGAPPPGANDRAAVMGQARPWQDGRPPVDCAMTPRDASCH